MAQNAKFLGSLAKSRFATVATPQWCCRIRRFLLENLAMISESQLLELLADLQTSQVERTISVGNTEKFCQAVCAFSNDFDRS